MTRRGLLAAAATLIIGASLATAAPVSAHAELVSSDPANGATLDALPTEIVLTFSENVGNPAGLSVVTADGTVLETGELEVVDDTMRLPLAAASATPGHYLISYDVTSADGHPIGGELHFLIAGSSGANPAPEVVVPEVGGGDDGGVDAAVTVVLAVLLAAALAAAVFATQRVVRRLAVDDTA